MKNRPDCLETVLAGGDGLADVTGQRPPARVNFHVVPQRRLHGKPFGAHLTTEGSFTAVDSKGNLTKLNVGVLVKNRQTLNGACLMSVCFLSYIVD